MADTKYIFVTGGVVSSLGKGIISASLGKLLQARGYKVTIQKFDPYINIDPGTLNPYEHGECYVTVDGHEADLDLGHYERFLNIPTTRANNVTTGRIYNSVIKREREGAYLGKTERRPVASYSVSVGNTSESESYGTAAGGASAGVTGEGLLVSPLACVYLKRIQALGRMIGRSRRCV